MMKSKVLDSLENGSNDNYLFAGFVKFCDKLILYRNLMQLL